MLDTDFILINQPHHTPTCYSRAWKMMSTPELAMASGDIEKLTKSLQATWWKWPCSCDSPNNIQSITCNITQKAKLELQEGKLDNFHRKHWTAMWRSVIHWKYTPEHSPPDQCNSDSSNRNHSKRKKKAALLVYSLRKRVMKRFLKIQANHPFKCRLQNHF